MITPITINYISVI